MKENQLEIKMAILLDGIMLTHYWIVELSANIVTEAIFNQVDDDAYDLSIFKEIIGHECDKTALTIDERQHIDNLQIDHPVRCSNNINPLFMTRGWKICV
jgi:hypothetical protein